MNLVHKPKSTKDGFDALGAASRREHHLPRWLHLGHADIIRYCNRPFSTVEEMDQAILERLNASVKTNDILHFLGDFCSSHRQESRIAMLYFWELGVSDAAKRRSRPLIPASIDEAI